MNDYKKMKPFPQQFDIVYGHQIDYKRIEYSTNMTEILSLAIQEHPMLVIQSFDEDNVVVGVFGTSNVTNQKKLNDLIILKGKVGLSKDTLFRFDGRTINLLNFTDEFFTYRKPLIIGSLNLSMQDEVKKIFSNEPKIESIIAHLKYKGQQILSKKERENSKFCI